MANELLYPRFVSFTNSRSLLVVNRALVSLVMCAGLFACTRLSPESSAPAATGTESASSSVLDSQLQGLQRQIATTREYNDALKTFLDSKEPVLAAALAADQSVRPTVQEFELRTALQNKLLQIDRDTRSCQEAIAAHERVLAKATTDPRHGELKSEIANLAGQREEMLRLRARLVTMTDRLSQ